ncbi:hypothetical protein PROFUN_07525 [Planoprotostelium fungivorum]|uniref:DH domain-containing protein n=1 Tax=Planoprotostelium fungivorum TaxID=1890364 RepID=A0A2P6NLN6_9EUKA|nr:hypothetical protein PROFUN_07525 [Planoprotostelium fungivorum]
MTSQRQRPEEEEVCRMSERQTPEKKKSKRPVTAVWNKVKGKGIFKRFTFYRSPSRSTSQDTNFITNLIGKFSGNKPPRQHAIPRGSEDDRDNRVHINMIKSAECIPPHNSLTMNEPDARVPPAIPPRSPNMALRPLTGPRVRIHNEQFADVKNFWENKAQSPQTPQTPPPKPPKPKTKRRMTRLFKSNGNGSLRKETNAFVTRATTEECLQLNRAVHLLRARHELYKRRRQHKYRTKIVEEIYTTEAVYSAALKHVVSFLTIVKDKNMIDIDNISIMFSNIEIIYKISEMLLSDLKECYLQWTPSTCIGTIFVRLAAFFKAYSPYVQNYDAASLLIKNEYEKVEIKSEWKEHGKSLPEEDRSFDLADFLIRPVQRIPRYKLLLQELYKNTWKEHRDYENIAKSIVILGGVAEHVNEKKRTADNRQKLIEFRDKLILPPSMQDFQLVTRHRLFVRELEERTVQEMRSGGIEKERKWHLMMCNDLIMFSSMTRNGSNARMKVIIPFHSCTVHDLSIPYRYIMQIIAHDQNEPKEYRIFFQNVEEQRAWMKDAEKGIKEIERITTFNEEHKVEGSTVLTMSQLKKTPISEPKEFRKVEVDYNQLLMPLPWRFRSIDDRDRYFGKRNSLFGKSATPEMFISSPLSPKRALIVTKARLVREAITIARHILTKRIL